MSDQVAGPITANIEFYLADYLFLQSWCCRRRVLRSTLLFFLFGAIGFTLSSVFERMSFSELVEGAEAGWSTYFLWIMIAFIFANTIQFPFVIAYWFIGKLPGSMVVRATK